MLALALAGCTAGGRSIPVATPIADAIPLGAVPRQAMARGECGLFLWKAGPGARLVLVAKSGPPPFARIVLDGRSLDLPRITGGDFQQEPNARYGDGRVTIALELTIEPRRGLSNGAVTGGSLRIDRSDGDGFVLPVSGLIACT